MTRFSVNFPDVGKEISLLDRGNVQQIHIDSGLNMRVWDIHFAQEVNLTKTAESIHSQFCLLFILTPDSIELESINQHVQYNNYRERHALLIPENVSVRFKVRARQPVQIIEFNISEWRLKELLAGRKLQQSFASFFSDPDLKTVYIETGSWQMNTHAGALFQHAHDGCEEPSGILSEAVTLIIDIVEKTFSTRTNDPLRGKDIYHGKMEEAEKILMLHLQDKLPNLSQIARQLAISESTLKRHFKIVYGKSIYGYYLARKMVLAKQLLEENHTTVSEMAEMLGYEKVSYFIEIFKKYHGISPGELTRRRRSSV